MKLFNELMHNTVLLILVKKTHTFPDLSRNRLKYPLFNIKSNFV